MKKITIIFCQSNADLLYTLDLINKHKYVIIYVINVKGIYEYLVSLEIEDIEVKFYPYFELSFFNPRSIYKVKKSLIDLWDNEFCQYNKCKVFFFSTSYDWFTASYVKRLSEENTVIYYNHYDHLTSLVGYNSFSLKRKIKQIIFSYVTKVDFLSQSNINFPKFNYEKYNIFKIDVLNKPDVNERFLYTVLGNIKKVLFLISPEEIENLEDSSKEKLISFIQNIRKNNIPLVLKGHPRLGEPEEMKPYVDFIIPRNIPSEFLNYKSFNFIFGLTSAALCYPAQKELCTVYSLVELLKYKDPLKQKDFKKYISKYSNHKIIFEFNKMDVFKNNNIII